MAETAAATATFHFEAIKPDGPVLRLEAAHEAVIPGLLGYFGVRQGHHPMLAVLGIGELTVRTAAGVERLMVSDGFCEVGPDRVVVLAETAELASDIDVDRAERARARARERIDKGNLGSADLERANQSLARSEARLKAARARP